MATPDMPADSDMTLVNQINALLAIQNPSHPVPGLARDLLERAAKALSAPSTTSTAEQAGAAEAPVAWLDRDYDWDAISDSKKRDYEKAGYSMERYNRPCYLRPTPATPEGLRPLCEALRARLDLARRVNAEAEYTISEDEMRAILSALQPQAQGGE